MHIEIEREVHNLTLTAVLQGRLLADEAAEAGYVPKRPARSRLLKLLNQLRNREGLHCVTSEDLDEMQGDIRRLMNEHREGAGDRPLVREHEDVWDIDARMNALKSLLRRWQLFHEAKSALDDKLAAVRQSDTLLAKAIE